MGKEQVRCEIGKSIYIVNRYYVGKQTLEELLLKLIFSEIKKSERT